LIPAEKSPIRESYCRAVHGQIRHKRAPKTVVWGDTQSFFKGKDPPGSALSRTQINGRAFRKKKVDIRKHTKERDQRERKGQDPQGNRKRGRSGGGGEKATSVVGFNRRDKKGAPEG